MSKTVLIYSNFNEWTAASFINDVDDLLEKNIDAELNVAINSNGGSPEYGWGMIHKFQQFPNKKSVVNHGKSYSFGAYFNCYTENTSCLDVTQFLIHRAAYAEWVEKDPEWFTEDMRNNLKNINAKLRAALEAKIDVEKFNNLKVCKDKGITLDDIFSMDARIDVFINAKDAKAIGLVDRIETITPKIKAELEQFEAAAKYIEPGANRNDDKKNKPLNKNKMTKAELKAAHPELYNEIYNDGVSAGTTEEQDRVGSIMAFAEVDPAMVKTAIASGKKLTETQRNELLLKAVKGQKAEAITDDSQKEITTGADKTIAEATAKETLDAEAKFLADYKAGK